ncbi:MAG: hypothetical protein HQL98_13025 [Magnetococcales bacterium]|nr:hypothetical protein [Magnetococcales bacterium]
MAAGNQTTGGCSGGVTVLGSSGRSIFFLVVFGLDLDLDCSAFFSCLIDLRVCLILTLSCFFSFFKATSVSDAVMFISRAVPDPSPMVSVCEFSFHYEMDGNIIDYPNPRVKSADKAVAHGTEMN